jgi:hypothetical protein
MFLFVSGPARAAEVAGGGTNTNVKAAPAAEKK